jgi:ElaB/YqjD/DUF883 family membrane-anchored ribosome-binding protein
MSPRTRRRSRPRLPIKREYGEKAQKAVEDFKPFVEKSLKDQPMATLAVAAVIGFALGALWKK